MRHGLVALLVACSMAIPTQVAAQDPFGFLSGIFSNARSLTLSYRAGQLNGSGPVTSDERCPITDVCGAGAELLIDLPSFGDGVGVELGFGASYFRGFASRDPGVDLRGSVRSLPTVAAYVSGLGPLIEGFPDALFPYFGLSFGLSDLWNARAYDEDGLQFEVKGQTFDWGLVAGMAYDIGISAYLLTELQYDWRRFSSLDWTLPSAANETLPANFPRALEFSGWRFNVGFQFQLQAEDPPEA